jgi:putative transcriptional regulator
LVASPNIHQTPFQKTVVYVLQHNRSGTFGVVLNRPANQKIKRTWQQLSGANFGESSIVQGGPIGGPVFAIHSEASLGEMEMPGGIFVSAETAKINELSRLDESTYRIVFGVAGWQAGQLDAEINNGKWLKLSAEPQHVFDEPELMWENFVRSYGREVFCDVVGIQKLPKNVWLNRRTNHRTVYFVNKRRFYCTRRFQRGLPLAGFTQF